MFRGISIIAFTLALIISACGKKDETTQSAPVPQVAPAAPAPTPAPTPISQPNTRQNPQNYYPQQYQQQPSCNYNYGYSYKNDCNSVAPTYDPTEYSPTDYDDGDDWEDGYYYN